METQELINILKFWGYPAMFVLMIIEGPIATMIAAFLSSLGIFNVGIVYILSILGDVLGDIILYAIGYYGGMPAFKKLEKLLKIKKSIIPIIQKGFQKQGAKIIFYVKATTGLCWITFALAGTIKMNFNKFFKYSLLGGMIWSGFLVSVGYFFGFAAERISQYIKYAGVAIFALAVLFFIVLAIYKKKQSEKFIKEINR